MIAAGIFLTALLVRSVYFVQYLESPLRGSYGVDHLYYLEWAKRIAAGDWLGSEVFEQGPLYAYWLGAFFALFGEALIPILIVQLLLGAGTCVLVYACGRRLFDHRTAALAGFLTAVYGPLVFYECAPMKSFLSPLLSVAVLYAGLRYGEDRCLRWLGLAGVAVGMACLVRENHILLLIPLALLVWTGRPKPDKRRRLWHCLIPILVAGLVLAPSAVRNGYLSGEFVPVTAGGGEVFYIAHGPSADGYYRTPEFVLATAGVEHEDFRREAQRRTGEALSRSEASDYWFRQGLRHILEDPLRALALTGKKALILFNDFEVPDNASYRAAERFIPVLNLLPSFGWVVGLGLLGIVLCLRDWRRFQLPLGIVAVHVVTILTLYNFGRFRTGMMSVWMLFAAYGLSWLVAASRQRLGKAAAVAAIVVLINALSFYPIQPLRYEVHAAQRTGMLAADAGDYERAERKLRRALRLLQEEIEQTGGASATQAYKLARTHQELARVYAETVRYDEALAHFRQAREIFVRPEIRKQLLRYELDVLQQTVPAPLLSRPDLPLRAEVEAVRAELRALR